MLCHYMRKVIDIMCIMYNVYIVVPTQVEKNARRIS